MCKHILTKQQREQFERAARGSKNDPETMKNHIVEKSSQYPNMKSMVAKIEKQKQIYDKRYSMENPTLYKDWEESDLLKMKDCDVQTHKKEHINMDDNDC